MYIRADNIIRLPLVLKLWEMSLIRLLFAKKVNDDL